MRFHLSEEQEMIRDTFDRALRDAIGEGRFHIADAATDLDPRIWETAMGLGLPGLLVSEEDGGAGLGMVEAALTSEMLGYHAAPGPIVAHVLATAAVAGSGDAALKEAHLPALLSGETIGAVAFDARWAPAEWTAAFEGGRLSGNFPLVPGAAHAQILVVGVAGPRLALVRVGDPGVEVTSVESADFTRRVANVVLSDAPAILIGDAASAGRLFASALVLIAADALGGAQACLDMSVVYAKERRQFGVPIGQFQAVKHQLADIALAVEPARALLWYAAYALDRGAEDAEFAAAHAKAHLSDCFTDAARRAVQVHGGIGYTWELGLHLWLRRALFDHAYLGSPSFHRERALQLSGL
jgi:alkylation response protein AidB-like acyl-CoA dehydrogenase